MKNVLKVVCAALAVTILHACGGESLEGVWLGSVPGMEGRVQGIELEAGGKASSVNMATLQYESWEKKGNELILKGKSIGNLQTLSIADTLLVRKHTRDSLVLARGDYEMRYSRTELLSVKGRLVIGHEVRSLLPDGASQEYWVSDGTGTLLQKYDELTGGVKNGMPVRAELEVVDAGKADDGFAADYQGVYEVVGIVGLEKE